MPNHPEAAQGRPVWIFMAATAMATTVSTLAATALVKAEATEPVAVTCTCDVPTPVAVPAPAPPAAEAPPAPTVPQAPAVEASTDEASTDETSEQAAEPPKAEVEGALDKEVIRRVVAAHINEVRHCYNEGLAGDPSLAGRVVVHFTIDPRGKVTRSTAESEMEGEVPTCIAKAVGRWAFPKPREGEVKVSYPFLLEPG
jgi:outer membrane biosynthesis protein TonB